VEVLDVLIAEEPTFGEENATRSRGSRGGEGAAVFADCCGDRSDRSIAALGAGFGPNGFLMSCLECLGNGLVQAKLQELGAYACAAELATHAAIAARLMLAWDPPPGTAARPCDALLATGGYSKLVSAASEAFCSLQCSQQQQSLTVVGTGHGQQQLPQEDKVGEQAMLLGHLALLLDCLRLGLGSEACTTRLLPMRRGKKRSKGCSDRGSRCEAAPLCPIALSALELASVYPVSGNEGSEGMYLAAALDAVAAAALQLLATAGIGDSSAPPRAVANQIATEVERLVTVRPLTTRLAAALRHLVCLPPCSSRRGTRRHAVAVGIHPGLGKDLRRALAEEDVAEHILRAAKCELQCGQNGAWRRGSSAGTNPRGLAAQVEVQAQEAIEAGELYDHVEAIVCAIRGAVAATDADLAELRSRCQSDSSASSHLACKGRKQLASSCHRRGVISGGLASLRQTVRLRCLLPHRVGRQ